MWVNSITLEYINYIMWAPHTNWEYSFTIYTFGHDFKFWVESYPRHYAQELLFTKEIFTGNIDHLNIN